MALVWWLWCLYYEIVLFLIGRLCAIICQKWVWAIAIIFRVCDAISLITSLLMISRDLLSASDSNSDRRGICVEGFQAAHVRGDRAGWGWSASSPARRPCEIAPRHLRGAQGGPLSSYPSSLVARAAAPTGLRFADQLERST